MSSRQRLGECFHRGDGGLADVVAADIDGGFVVDGFQGSAGFVGLGQDSLPLSSVGME